MMNYEDIIKGLRILEAYTDPAEPKTVEAHQDILYAEATTRPLTNLSRYLLLNCGWEQEGYTSYWGEYDPKAIWYCYT